MKLEQYRGAYYEYSGKASDIARQLGFAGIALIWAFKTNNSDGSFSLAPELLLAGALIVAGLSFDLLQYVVAAVIWGTYSRHKEKQGIKSGSNLDAPRYFNWPGLAFFTLKIVSILSAYVVLFCFLWNQLA